MVHGSDSVMVAASAAASADFLKAISMTHLATPAAARDRYYHRHGSDDAAIAIGAGLIGLAIGAAIASNHDDRYYGDRYYYDNGYYYPRYRGYDYYYRRYPNRYYERDYYIYRNYNGYGYHRERRHDDDD